MPTSQPPRPYPHLIACIGEGRRAERAEIRHLAARIMREGFPVLPTRPVERRRVFRRALIIARAALGTPR